MSKANHIQSCPTGLNYSRKFNTSGFHLCASSASKETRSTPLKDSPGRICRDCCSCIYVSISSFSFEQHQRHCGFAERLLAIPVQTLLMCPCQHQDRNHYHSLKGLEKGWLTDLQAITLEYTKTEKTSCQSISENGEILGKGFKHIKY